MRPSFFLIEVISAKAGLCPAIYVFDVNVSVLPSKQTVVSCNRLF